MSDNHSHKLLWFFSRSDIYVYHCIFGSIIQSNAVKLVELAELVALDDLLGKC